ncbi:MAG: chain-length determining protein [Bacteroides sp.]|nr:chain-length determining protein [Bacteroides sp.]
MVEDKNYTNAPLEEDELEIDLMEYVRKLWNARMLLLKVAAVAAIIGIIIGFSFPKRYTAEVVLSPESTKNANSRLSSMASMLGLGNMGAGSDANALNFSMASDIIASTPFILELINTPIQTLDGKMDTTLVAYLGTQSVPWWNTVMSLPSKAIGGIMSLFSSNNEQQEEKPINPFHLTPRQRGQINAVKGIINVETEKGGMTKLSVTVQDPLVAATMADTVLVKLQKFITKYKTSKAEEDCKYWEQLYNQRQKEYYAAQEKYAKYSDANKNIVLQSIRIEQERLQNEQALAFQIFSQVATQLQMSKAKLQEEKPAFAILEPASVPLYPTGTNKKIIILGLAFLAVAITSAWILFGKDLWQSLKEGIKEPTEKKE